MSGGTASGKTTGKPAQPRASTPSLAKSALLPARAAALQGPTIAPPIVNETLRSRGQPLGASSRSFFEPRFGHDFSKVRVHHDQQAASSARAVNAHAYTVGPNIVFGPGRYAPGTPDGRALIAHELTHVVQQKAARVDLRANIPLGSTGTAREREADHAASTVSVRPFSVPIVAHPSISRVHLQRKAAGDLPPPVATGRALSMPLAPTVDPTQGDPSSADGDDGARARRKARPGAIREPADARDVTPSEVASASTRTAIAPQPATSREGSATEGSKITAPAPSTVAKAAEPETAEKSPKEEGKAEEGEKKDEGAEARGGKEAGADKVPTSPMEDPGFQAMVGNVQQSATKEKAHSPAGAKADEAQRAAVTPPTELKGRASAAQAAAIDREQPKPFDRSGFIKALLDKIASIAPKTLAEADDFKESGKVASIKGGLAEKVAAGKTQAQGDIPSKVAQAPDPSGVTPKPVTPLVPAEAGPQPSDVGAGAAVPKPRGDSEISLMEGSQSLDHKMADAKVTESQLAKSNEPEFQGALDSKKTAQADAVKAPQDFRKDEKGTIGRAKAEAQGTAQKQLRAMHGGRAGALEKVGGHQVDAKAKDEQARAQVAGEIQKRYDEAKNLTEARLKRIDNDVDTKFDHGATEAQKAFDDEVDSKMSLYKDDRYSGVGAALWVKDKLLGLPDEVNEFYVQAREGYIRRMTGVLNSVAGIVEIGLNQAKAIIADGRKSIDDYLNGLPDALKVVGQEAAKDIKAKFDDLEHSVDDKKNELVDRLAQKYAEKLQQVDDKIAEMKKSNGGLVDAAIEAIGGVIDSILKLKDLLLNILAKAGAAIDLIIDDPIGFLGNLVAAVKQGFLGFVGKIGVYLQQGLLGWLFGALGEAGIELPKSFDLRGIFGLILQVLGLTYANIRARAVKILGPKVVSALETTAEIFLTLINEGPAELWKWIKDQVTALKDAVLGSIKDFVLTKIITAGVTWIISLLNPASAFIKACKAIYDIVMFFVERGSQIIALVNAILDSIINIAKGNIAGAAAYVESVLAKTIPIVISFLASLLGVGGISEKIKEVIERIRAPINTAIDWVINKAVDLVKAAGKFLGFGKEAKDEKDPDPEHERKVNAGLLALDRESAPYRHDRKISQEDASRVAGTVKQQHPIFARIDVVGKDGHWKYRYVASDPKDVEAGEQDDSDDLKVIFANVTDIKPPGRSLIGALTPSSKELLAAQPGARGAAAELEKQVGKSLADKLGVDTPDLRSKDRLPARTPKGLGMERLPADPTLLHEPKANLGGVGRADDQYKRPDFVVLSPSGEPQVEVFEVTLDADFRIPENKDSSPGGPSHKRIQVAGTIFALAKRYPGVPIIYNIRATKPPSEGARKDLEAALKEARGAKNPIDVQIIWRIG